MALNTITIDFDPCEPTPANGYRVAYRPLGSIGAYRIWPVNFFNTPAEFTDTHDPIGTSYEGFIQGDCGGGKFGVPIPWVAENSSSESSVPAPSESSAPSESGSVPEPLCTFASCGKYQATGEATDGTNFTWTDCDGIEQTTFIAFNAQFEFCTCDDDPQYTTANVTVLRIGYCSATEFFGGVGSTEGEACSASSTLYIGPGHTVVEPGATIYNDVPPLTGVGTCIVRDPGGTLWFVVGSVVTGPTGNSC